MTTPARNGVEPMTFSVSPEVIVELEKLGRPLRSNTIEETAVLKCIHMDEAIRVHLAEGNVHSNERQRTSLKRGTRKLDLKAASEIPIAPPPYASETTGMWYMWSWVGACISDRPPVGYGIPNETPGFVSLLVMLYC